jgi:hypothetical protein
MRPSLLLQTSPVSPRACLLVAGTSLGCLAAAVPRPAYSDPPGGWATTITARVTDPRDTPGLLDVAIVGHRIRDYRATRPTSLRYVVRTFTAFSDADLEPESHRVVREFVLELNRDGEPGSERNVRISCRDGDLVADVISNATREVIATVPVYRRDPRTLVVSGHPRLVGARSYFWYSDYHVDGSADCGSSDGFPVTCQDDVPERGWIRLDHPGWPASAGQRLR